MLQKRCALRQRTPRSCASRRERPSAEVAVRYAQKASGPVPSEPARQARRCSGRSVIVVGPRRNCINAGCRRRWRSSSSPFIYVSSKSAVSSPIKQAKEMVELQHPEVWDVLEEVIREHPVLLNRADAPWLGIRRLSRCWSKARRFASIRLSARRSTQTSTATRWRSIFRCRLKRRSSSVLMLSSNNALSPAHGAPIAFRRRTSCWLHTSRRPSGAKGEGRAFGNADDVMLAVGRVSSKRCRQSGCITGDLQT